MLSQSARRHTEEDGGLVAIDFRWTGKPYSFIANGRERKEDFATVRKTTVYFRPELNWLPELATVEANRSGQTFVADRRFVYTSSRPIKLRGESTEIESPDMKISKQSEYELQHVELPPDRFRLTYYGLPEATLESAGGSNKSWYLLATIGVILILLALIVRKKFGVGAAS